MKILHNFARVAVVFLLCSPALSDGWAEDYLVGHFLQGIVVTGEGYSSFECLYGTDDDMLVTFVNHQGVSRSGDILTLNKSFNNGYTWTRTNTAIQGGGNTLLSPSFAPIPGTDTLLVAIVTDFNTDASNTLDTYKYTYANNITYHRWSQADYSYPGAQEPVSCFVLNNEVSGEIWLFAESSNNWLYLTRSSDGTTWSSSVPVAANVSRPSAVVSSDGQVAVTWTNSISHTILCSIASPSATFSPAVTVSESGAELASPVPGWEHIGNENLGIVWHSEEGESYITISEDQGDSWGDSHPIGTGVYPYINSFEGTRRMAVCYTSTDGDVYVTNALTINAVPSATFVARSHHEAYSGASSRVVYGEEPGQLALFFLSPAVNDLWVTSSRFIAGIEEPETSDNYTVTAGPNPGAGSITVSSTGFGDNVEYSIYSINGRLVDHVQPHNGNAFLVDAGSFPAGMYTIVASGNGRTASCRIVRF